jgi:hypothetical protein
MLYNIELKHCEYIDPDKEEASAVVGKLLMILKTKH